MLFNISGRSSASLSAPSVKNPIHFAQRLYFRLEVLLRAVNLRYENNGFTSLPKEVILRILRSEKNPSNPRMSDPMASVLTSGPPGSGGEQFEACEMERRKQWKLM